MKINGEIDLDALQTAITRVGALLNDRHPGLMTWNQALLAALTDTACIIVPQPDDAFNDAVEAAIERRMNEDLGAILVEHEDKIKRRLIDPMAEALRNAAAVIGELDSQISQMEGMFSDEDGQIADAREEADETCTQIEAMLKHHEADAPLPVPQIYITMDGGLIEDVYSSGSLIGASYTIIDYDTEGAEEVQSVHRTDGTVTEACIGGGTVGEFTSKIVADDE